MARRGGGGFSRGLVANLVSESGDLPLLIILLGPTASGKTALSLELAEELNGEIVSCDSVAVYRELEIGTAKPTAVERDRITHHMLDVVDPPQPYTAGDYSRGAREALASIVERGRVPIVTGGTGLYLRALVDGLFAGPARSEAVRDRLRQAMERHGESSLHRILRRLDPASAALIHPNDTPKLIRAIEVSLTAGKPMSIAWEAGRDPLAGYRILRIGLEPERQALYRRINQRADAMFREGLIAETEQLVAKYGPDCRSLDSLGYKQARAVLGGSMTLAEAVKSAQQGHRNYAKRQLTWFRREPEVRWLPGFGDDPEVRTQARRVIAETLAESL